MIVNRSLAACLALMATAGCTARSSPEDAATAVAAEGLNPSSYPALMFRHAPVMYFDSSNYVSKAGRGGYGVSFHVDVAVENLAYDKQVGIVWTYDSWQHVETCALAYERPLDDGMELWGADCGKDTEGQTSDPYFAAYAAMNGTTYWDSNGGWNYAIGPTPAGPDWPTPERAVSAWDEGIVGGVASGKAAVWSYPGTRAVSVVYTTDGWATTRSFSATPQPDGTWSWSIPLSAPSGATFTWAVSYDVGGVTFWDDAGGRNYSDPIP